jgi:hypothetical protein
VRHAAPFDGFSRVLTVPPSSHPSTPSQVPMKIFARMSPPTQFGSWMSTIAKALVRSVAALIPALLSLFALPQTANGQASETFTNIPTESPSTYASRSWTGDDSVTWTALLARTDQTINGKAITFDSSGTRSLTSPTYAGGMGTLTFEYVRAFTGTSARSLEVWVNSAKIGSTITVSPTSNDVVVYSSDINVSGN